MILCLTWRLPLNKWNNKKTSDWSLTINLEKLSNSLTYPKFNMSLISYKIFDSFWVKTNTDIFSLIPKYPSPSAKPTNQPNQLGSSVVLNLSK